MQRTAKQCEKEEAAQKALLKKAIQQNNTEGAKIYANSVIRKRNEGLNYLRLSARFDAIYSQLQSAMLQKQVSKTMSGIVDLLSKAVNTQDLEQVLMAECPPRC